MGVNFQRLNRWLNKPTWGDFIIQMIGWALVQGMFVVYIVSTANERLMWLTVLYTLLLVAFYVVMFVSGYRHVKSHLIKNKVKK